MALAGITGRAISGTFCSGTPERIWATTRTHAAPSPGSPSEPATAIATEICEFTELLGKLGELRDSGLLTAEEFSRQKDDRRLGR